MHAAVATNAPYLSIGQVLARLTPEFPDLTPSKLRFLEEQELIRPARTSSGYRKFSPGDIERVRSILSMQRHHYLPLKVIRRYLADCDAAKNPPFPGSPPKGRLMFSTGRHFDRAEVVREAAAGPGLLNDAISAGLVPASDRFGDNTVEVLRALVELQRYGIEPRHLRTVKSAADRELGLIESALAPLVRRQEATSKAQLADRARDIASNLDVVRSGLIRSALARIAR